MDTGSIPGEGGSTMIQGLFLTSAQVLGILGWRAVWAGSRHTDGCVVMDPACSALQSHPAQQTAGPFSYTCVI